MEVIISKKAPASKYLWSKEAMNYFYEKCPSKFGLVNKTKIFDNTFKEVIKELKNSRIVMTRDHGSVLTPDILNSIQGKINSARSLGYPLDHYEGNNLHDKIHYFIHDIFSCIGNVHVVYCAKKILIEHMVKENKDFNNYSYFMSYFNNFVLLNDQIYYTNIMDLNSISFRSSRLLSDCYEYLKKHFPEKCTNWVKVTIPSYIPEEKLAIGIEIQGMNQKEFIEEKLWKFVP